MWGKGFPSTDFMSQVSSSLTPTVSDRTALRQLGRMYLELAKARLSGLVVVTTAVGYLVASRGHMDVTTFLWTILGTCLAAAAANTLNQVMEVERDARMPRTAGRPLPAGRMSVPHAAAAGVLAGGAGLTILAAAVNALTAGLALLTIAVYLLVYTPLKSRSTLNTLAGAVVGAIPPMMGWAAATGRIDAGAWALGALLFVWQVPHFLALAWMFRKDYELGGYRMLPSVDPTGSITCRTVLMWSAALVPVAWTATAVGISGSVYGVVSIALGIWLLYLAGVMYRRRTQAAARRLFLATVTYLPLLMIVMVLDGPATRKAGSGVGTSMRAATLPVPIVSTPNAEP
jgi:heme o synthase